jgi:hypothetical protein
MKKILLVILTCFALNYTAIQAQSAQETNITIAKTTQPCVMATYAFGQDLLDQTIIKKMEAAGAKNYTKKKGFIIYKAINIPELATEKLDVFIKTDGKNEISICYVSLSLGNDNFINSKVNATTIDNLKSWMNNLVADAAIVKLDNDTKAAEEELKKADKAYAKGIEEGKDLQEKLNKVQKQIEENKADMAIKLQELDAVKAKVGAATDAKAAANELKKSDKAYSKSLAESTSLLEKLAKVQKQIADNKNEVAKLLTQADAVKAKLAALQAQNK